MDNAERKSNMQDMQEGSYPKKKKTSVAGQFAAVKYRSETYCWTKKSKQGRLRAKTSLAGWDLKLAVWDYDF